MDSAWPTLRQGDYSNKQFYGGLRRLAEQKITTKAQPEGEKRDLRGSETPRYIAVQGQLFPRRLAPQLTKLHHAFGRPFEFPSIRVNSRIVCGIIDRERNELHRIYRFRGLRDTYGAPHMRIARIQMRWICTAALAI